MIAQLVCFQHLFKIMTKKNEMSTWDSQTKKEKWMQGCPLESSHMTFRLSRRCFADRDTSEEQRHGRRWIRDAGASAVPGVVPRCGPHLDHWVHLCLPADDHRWSRGHVLLHQVREKPSPSPPLGGGGRSQSPECLLLSLCTCRMRLRASLLVQTYGKTTEKIYISIISKCMYKNISYRVKSYICRGN